MTRPLVTITHLNHGTVEAVISGPVFDHGCNPKEPSYWFREEVDGSERRWFRNKGWREVSPKPQWRNATEEVFVSQDESEQVYIEMPKYLSDAYGQRIYLERHLKITKSHALVLPDGMTWEDLINREYYLNAESVETLEDTFERLAQPVLTVWQRKEGCCGAIRERQP